MTIRQAGWSMMEDKDRVEFAFDRKSLVILAISSVLTALSCLSLGILVGVEIRHAREMNQPLQADGEPTAPRSEKGPPPLAQSASAIVVDVGSFRDRANAESLGEELKGLGYSVTILGDQGHDRGWTLVRVGPYGQRAEAVAAAAKLAHVRGCAPVVRDIKN